MPSNSKAIKNRIKSVDSTLHMAKAMELVASSKTRRATENMQKARSYSDAMMEAISSIDYGECSDNVFVVDTQNKKPCVIIIAGDRGLAGGYNNNVFKKTAELGFEGNVYAVPIGKRAVEYAKRRGYELSPLSCGCVEKFTASDAAAIARELVSLYKKGDIDCVYVVYTEYNSALTQTPKSVRILPVSYEKGKRSSTMAEFEPDPSRVLDAVMPDYVSGVLMGSVCEGYLCELSSRRNAMNNAEQNASEMIDKLTLEYNRARQGAITQEITEIVAGSGN